MKSNELYFVIQQLSRNRRSIIAWTVIWTLLGLLFSTVYKTMSATAGESARIYEALPPAILKAVNISTDYLTKPESFLSGQFLTVYLLAGSVFAIILGVNAIGGKINDKTILAYLSKRLSRVSIYLLQALVIVITLIIFNVIIGITLINSFNIFSGSHPSVTYIISTFMGASLIYICFASIGMIAGTIMEKSQATAFGSALAVFSFFINGLGSLAGVPSWLQKFSVYYYLDTVKLRESYTIDSRIVVIVILSAALIALGAYLFRKKDLYL